MTRNPKFMPLPEYRRLSEAEMRSRAAAFLAEMRRRRSVRDFSDANVPREVIEDCLRTAGTAPSGANLQPWHFVVVSSPEVKRRIRQAAEKVEREFYQRRAPEQWLAALAPLGTGPDKPFLETAPYLIAVFVQQYGLEPDGRKVKHYYPTESTGIALGILITAIHRAGLVSLPYTPSPMGFLNEILDRPKNERPMMILIVGHPADELSVPGLDKKTLAEIATFVR